MIKVKPFWLSWFTAPWTWVTIYPYIYRPAHLDPVNFQGVIAHEKVHLERQAAGRWRWLWRWFTDRQFRLDEEVLGMAAEIRWCSSAVEQMAILNSYAFDLASSRYLHAAPSVEVAKRLLLEAARV